MKDQIMKQQTLLNLAMRGGGSRASIETDHSNDSVINPLLASKLANINSSEQ